MLRCYGFALLNTHLSLSLFLKSLMCFKDACSSWLFMFCSDALKGPSDEPGCQRALDVQRCPNPDVH